MRKYKPLNVSDIVITAIEGIDPADAPDFVDAFATFAYYRSTDVDLTDEELDVLNEYYSGYVQQATTEYQY